MSPGARPNTLELTLPCLERFLALALELPLALELFVALALELPLELELELSLALALGACHCAGSASLTNLCQDIRGHFSKSLSEFKGLSPQADLL